MTTKAVPSARTPKAVAISCVTVLNCNSHTHQLIPASDLAVPTRLLDDGDEDVLERVTLFVSLKDLDAARFKPTFEPADSGRRLIVNDHVQAIAEERHAPSIHLAFERVGRALRVIGDQFNKMSALRRLDPARRALGYKFARDHKTQPVALFGLFQIVR